MIKIGKTYLHPDGYLVRITSGQFHVLYGMSNFWYWDVLDKNGDFVKKGHGYGNFMHNEVNPDGRLLISGKEEVL